MNQKFTDFERKIISDTEDAIQKLEEESGKDGLIYMKDEYAGEYDEDIEYAGEYDEDIEYAGEYDEDIEYADEYDEDIEYADEYDEDIEYADEYDEDIEYADEYYEDIEYADEYDESAEYSDEYDEEMEYADEYDEEMEYADDLNYEELDEEESFRPVRRRNGFIGRIKAFLSGAHGVDALIAATGILVVMIGVVTAVAWRSSASVEEQVTAMASVGENLSGVTVVGQDTLLAVKDAYVSLINSVPTEEEANENNVQVTVNFTSIEKDLKVKFLNKETGELISGVGFKIELTDSKEKKTELMDENKDGIIYETKMKAGTYKVVCLDVGGFTFPQESVDVKVKDKVEYQKIDIADEIKKESQINVGAEDTKKAEKPEESKLADTVEWVESTKTAINSDSNYNKIEKSTIPDPSTLGRAAGSYLKMAAVNVAVNGAPSAPKVGDAGGTLTASVAEEGVAISTKSWSSSNSSVVAVDASSGAYTIAGEGEATITVQITGTKSITVSGNTTTEEVTGTGTCKITVSTKPVDNKVTGISITSTVPAEVLQGGSAEFTAKVEVTGNKSTDINWSCSEGATLSKSTSTSGEVITVNVKSDAAAGTEIKVTATAKDDTSVAATKSFKVKEAPLTTYIESVGVTPSTLDIPAGTSKKLEAKVTKKGTGTIDEGVTWSIADADKQYLTLAADGTVTGLAAGVGKTVTVTATTKGVDSNKKQLSATAKVTVTKATAALTLDKTALTIAQGKEDTIKATVANLADTKVTWKSDNEKIVTVDANGKVKGIAVGTANITVTTSGKEATATCKVTVVKNAQLDSSTKLKDKNGNQVYIKVDGKYREAVYADYYTASEFFIKGEGQYRYTGWQTIDNKTYFFTKNGDKVTGEQVIQGVKYNFASDGSLSMGNGSLGIDVSRYNGNINWQAVKNSGVSYAIIRSGYRGYGSGVLVEDSKFKANMQGATAAGLKVGVYFVTQAVNEVEAVQEASMVLEQVKNYRISYPIFLDVEKSGGRGDNIDRNTRTAVVNAFCSTIKNSGYGAGVYANKDWLDNKMNAGQLSAHKIWLAQYATTPTYKGRYDLWQYTSKGSIGGVSGHVDLNTSYLGY